MYFGGMTVEVRCCNYFLMTGRKRPCEAGKGCKVRKEGGREKRKAMTVKKG